MALAPALIVSIMDWSLGPPVAIIAISGKFFRIFSTSLGVSAPADTLSIATPDLSRAAISSCSLTTVTTIGMSMIFRTFPKWRWVWAR